MKDAWYYLKVTQTRMVLISEFDKDAFEVQDAMHIKTIVWTSIILFGEPKS